MKGVYTVGMVHKCTGLEPRWFPGGYRFMQKQIVAITTKRVRGRGEHLARILDAVNTAVLLDIDLAISAYQDAIEEEKRKTVTSVVEIFGMALEKLEQGDLGYSIQTETTCRTPSSRPPTQARPGSRRPGSRL